MIERAPVQPAFPDSYCIPDLQSYLAAGLRTNYFGGIFDAYCDVVGIEKFTFDVSCDE